MNKGICSNCGEYSENRYTWWASGHSALCEKCAKNLLPSEVLKQFSSEIKIINMLDHIKGADLQAIGLYND